MNIRNFRVNRGLYMATQQSMELGRAAPDFDLPSVDGKRYTLAEVRGPKGLVIMFICNHCPYVKAVREKIIRDCNDLAGYGVNSIAISSNDPSDYPEDSFDNMKQVAREFKYPFPYVWDESQDVARAYGAACTPEFFGFNADLELRYHGRLDASGRSPAPRARRELFEAMVQVAQTGVGPAIQEPSIGCSIKWKADG
jgi:peroxiredoxin